MTLQLLKFILKYNFSGYSVFLSSKFSGESLSSKVTRHHNYFQKISATYGAKYSRMDQVKFVEDSLEKHLKKHGLPKRTTSL